MSTAAINAVLSDRSSTGVYRLAMLAIADGGGYVSIEGIQRWVNCDEPSAVLLLDDLCEMGVVEMEFDDTAQSVAYFSSFVHELTYGFVPSPAATKRYIPPAVRDSVAEKCGHTCQYCGDTEGPFHIDHIHPISKGGGNEMENLTLACAPCNLSKRDKTLDEWPGRVGGPK